MDDFVRKSTRSPLQTVTPRSQPTRVEPRSSASLPVVEPPAPELPVPPQLEKTSKKPGKKFSFKLPKPKNKLQWGIALAAMGVLLLGSSFSVYWFIFRKTPAPVAYVPPVVEVEPEPEPTTVASRVSGRQIDKANPEHSIYAVQIENSPDARPQSGLKDADIISEAVAEGGITRFNAIFHDNTPSNIGPVRSLRPYYIDWFAPYNAAIVHAGGSPEALADIKSMGLQDMDNVSGYFRRESKRYAPHNLYTSGAQMLDLFTKRGYKNASPVPSLPRKEAAPAATPTASTINLKISSALYNVVFTYDKASNTYLRAQGGAPHIDADSGQQLAPSVVIVPVMSKSIHPDRVHTKYGSVGSGKVFVFQDGIVTEGTWNKPARTSQWQLTDAAGAVIALNPGQTWFTMIDAAGSVSFTP